MLRNMSGRNISSEDLLHLLAHSKISYVCVLDFSLCETVKSFMGQGSTGESLKVSVA